MAADRTATINEFGFRELLPLQQQLYQPPKEQELQPLQSLRDQQVAMGSMPDAVGPGGDRGHLGLASSSYQSAREQALRRASSSGSLRGSGSSKTLQLQPQQQLVAQPQEPQAEQQSAWHRWFGGGKKEEELLLPVPMRAKCVCAWVCGGDEWVLLYWEHALSLQDPWACPSEPSLLRAFVPSWLQAKRRREAGGQPLCCRVDHAAERL